jgi:hypothetical protein
MSASKTPGRIIDGPYAAWGTADEDCQIVLTNGSTVKLGQPLAIDVTQLGPDQNVPNNGALLPQCERVVATTSGNAGPLFGVVKDVPGAPTGVTVSTVSGVRTWTNSSGATLTLNVQVRQTGYGLVYAGTAAIGQTGGNSILVGSKLITTTAQTFAIQGTAAIGTTVGYALATAISTSMATGGAGNTAAGVISVIPGSLVGIVPNSMVTIDTPQSGQQEAVSVGSISYPTFSIALVNAHPAGFRITGPNANPAVSSVLISTPGAGVTTAGLVAAWINIFA